MNTFQIIQSELEEIISVARNTAESDGQLTQDEIALLDVVENQLKSIQDDLQGIATMLPEDLEESEIRKRVRLLAQDIIPKLISKSEEDGSITHDEKAILDNLINKII